MPVQVNIFLLLFGALQGVFLSLVLLQKKVHKAGYGFLVLYLVVMVLQITLKVMSKVWLMSNLQPLYTLSYYFPLLYGPFVFCFTSGILFNKKFSVYSWLHFLPFVLAAFLVVFGSYYSWPSFVTAPLFNPAPRLVLELISIIIYHTLAYRNWNVYKSNLKEKSSDISLGRLNWIKQFTIISCAACIIITLAIYCMYIWFPWYQEIRFGFVALVIFIYWISYCAWNHPHLFSKDVPDEAPKAIIIAPPLTFYSAVKKYSNSGLCIEEEQRIINRLDELMERQKLFLEPNITIDKLAIAINCSKHHLSQVLNACIQKSFYDYINFYRVEEAKALLTNDAFANHKIASIAYDAGFNSLSTFNDVFKKLTGITPSQYRKQPPLQSQARKQRV